MHTAEASLCSTCGAWAAIAGRMDTLCRINTKRFNNTLRLRCFRDAFLSCGGTKAPGSGIPRLYQPLPSCRRCKTKSTTVCTARCFTQPFSANLMQRTTTAWGSRLCKGCIGTASKCNAMQDCNAPRLSEPGELHHSLKTYSVSTGNSCDLGVHSGEGCFKGVNQTLANKIDI